MGNQSKYPEGTRLSNYSIIEEKQRDKSILTVRRRVYFPDGSKRWERLDATRYATLRDNHRELENLVHRLNKRIPEELRAVKSVTLKLAFISEDTLAAYKMALENEIPSAQGVNTQLSYLKKYGLNYFTGLLNLPDPLDWKKKETIWGKALMNNITKEEEKTIPRLLKSDDPRLAGDTLRKIIQATNRFIRWMHDRNPEEYPLVILEPLKPAMFRKRDAERISDGEDRNRRFIPDRDWKKIDAKLPEELAPFVRLAYLYGLRRGEALGITHPKTEIKTKSLHLQWQLLALPESKDDPEIKDPKYGPMKGRDDRHVPHWFCDAYECRDLIRSARKLLIARDTLGKRFTDYTATLGMTYTLHDLRHTWTTRAAGITKSALELMQAAGHRDLNTTNKYIKLAEKLDDELLED